MVDLFNFDAYFICAICEIIASISADTTDIINANAIGFLSTQFFFDISLIAHVQLDKAVDLCYRPQVFPNELPAIICFLLSTQRI